MFTKRDRNEIRKIRHERVRKKISGTPEMPRLSVYRSLNNIYVQVIDDVAGKTLVSCSTLDPQIKGQLSELDKKGAGKLVGKTVAERALQAGIKKVVFDRGGYVYTGRVAEVAAGAREAGLDFSFKGGFKKCLRIWKRNRRSAASAASAVRVVTAARRANSRRRWFPSIA